MTFIVDGRQGELRLDQADSPPSGGNPHPAREAWELRRSAALLAT